MSTKHDCEFGTWNCVLSRTGSRCKYDTQSMLWILLVWNGARNEISKALDRKQLGVWIPEINDHDCHSRGRNIQGSVFSPHLRIRERIYCGPRTQGGKNVV